MKKKSLKVGKSYDEWIVQKLKNDEKAQLEYIKASFEDNFDCPRAILIALGHVVEARGFTSISKAAHLNRESLYKMLSTRGNPKWETIYKLVSALDMKLVVEAKTGTEG